MIHSKKTVATLVLALALLCSCQNNQEARKPISYTSGTFMRESVDRNKKLIAGEEAEIARVIRKNKKIKFISSPKGFWYAYATINVQDTATPKKGDVALFDYEIKDLKGRIIYSKNELGPQTYFVDKQNIMTGLREGIKLMHRKEKMYFLFTSHVGYGYHGDNRKIGTNEPLFCIVTLRDFLTESDYDKKMKIEANLLPENQNDSITN
jgi:gliding motility-associated peptidyl-prolyl isomerase